MSTSKYPLSKVAGTAASLKNRGNFKRAIAHLYNTRSTAISEESAKAAQSIKKKTNNAARVDLTPVVKKAASAYGNQSFKRSRNFSTTSKQNLSQRPQTAKSQNFIFEASLSIGKDLMPIDQATKDLISCDKQNRSKPKANNQVYNWNHPRAQKELKKPVKELVSPRRIKPIKRKAFLSKSDVMVNAKQQLSSRSSKTGVMNSKYKSISEQFPYGVKERIGGNRHDNRYTPPIRHLSKICKDTKATHSASSNNEVIKRQSHSAVKAWTVDTRYVQPKKEIEVLGSIMRKAKQMEKVKRTNENAGKNKRIPAPKFDLGQFKDLVNAQPSAPAKEEALFSSDKLEGEESGSDDEVDDYVGLLTKNAKKNFGDSEAEKLAKNSNTARIEVLGKLIRKPLNTKQQAAVGNWKKQAKQMEKAKRKNENTGKNERVPTPKFGLGHLEDQVNVQPRAPAKEEALLSSDKLQGEESESDDDQVDNYVGLLTKNAKKKYEESEAEKLARTTNVQITKPYNNDYMLKQRSQSLPYKKSYRQESATSRIATLSDMRSSHAKHLIRLKKSNA